MADVCACEQVPVLTSSGTTGRHIDPFVTTDRILAAARAGGMELLRADCPLEQTNALFESDTRYTLRHYLRCTGCGRTALYGLCVRGLPIYLHVDAQEPLECRWERSDTFVDRLGGPVRWFGED